jgi:hypothetical protein
MYQCEIWIYSNKEFKFAGHELIMEVGNSRLS